MRETPMNIERFAYIMELSKASATCACAEGPRRMGPCVRRDDREPYPPAFSALAKLTSSSSEDDTEGTCSPSEAREMATRVLLKTVSALATCALRLFNSSVISTLCWPLPSSATL